MELKLDPQECSIDDYVPENYLQDHEEVGPYIYAIRKYINLSIVREGTVSLFDSTTKLTFEYCIIKAKSKYGVTQVRAWKRIE